MKAPQRHSQHREKPCCGSGLVARLLSLLAVPVWLLCSPTPSFAQFPELKKVRFLFVIDSSSDLKDSVSVDKKRMQIVTDRGIPKDQYDLRILEGDQVTPKNILNHFKNLRTDSTECLCFYYAGHGAYDPDRGQFLRFGPDGKGGTLTLAELKRTMELKRAGKVVLLTDCCSNLVKIAENRRRRFLEPYRPAKEIHPVVRSLFFRPGGTVVITAAAVGTSSWGDEQDGGIFTRAFYKTVAQPLEKLDDNHDGLVSWKEFYPKLARETEQTFITWKKDVARGEKIDQTSQKPQAIELPDDIVALAGPKTYAVVSIRNDAMQAIAYQHRWVGEEAWKDATLAPQGKAYHEKLLANEKSSLPELEIKFLDKTRKLGPKTWVGDTPTFESGRVYFFFGKPKTQALDLQGPGKDK